MPHRKNKRRLLLLLIIALSLWACASPRWQPSSPPHSIVTVDGTQVPPQSFRKQLEHAVLAIEHSEDRNNIILFIHGRGKHPEKAHKQHLLTDLEDNYNAKVLMYHWPSWNGICGFPVEQARAAAVDFNTILKQLHTFKQEHTQRLANIRFTLLTQSMGSLVLEEAIKNWGPGTPPPLFDTLVLSAPASATQAHKTWIERLTLADHVYITSHRHDPVLSSAAVHTQQSRLGQTLPSDPNELATNASYLDVSSAWVVHRYYLHRYLKFTPHMKHFYNQTLNGMPAELNSHTGFKRKTDTPIFKLTNTD